MDRFCNPHTDAFVLYISFILVCSMPEINTSEYRYLLHPLYIRGRLVIHSNIQFSKCIYSKKVLLTPKSYYIKKKSVRLK